MGLKAGDDIKSLSIQEQARQRVQIPQQATWGSGSLFIFQVILFKYE